MKACKYCGSRCEDNVVKCPNCGAPEFSNICDNCGQIFNTPYCPNCGVKAGSKGVTCPRCGRRYFSPHCPGCGFSPLESRVTVTRQAAAQVEPVINRALICCPKCGSTAVSQQTFQETIQSVTTGTSSVNIKERRHGFFWWVFIGWWWMIIKGIFWIYAFIPMLIIRACRRKRQKATVATASTTKNVIQYKVVCTCQNCGNIWNRK